MTSPQHSRRVAPALMVGAFPTPGEEVRLAYRELHIAVNGSEEQKRAPGNHALLPRPWEPASCLDPDLRHGLWEWLEEVVIWLNFSGTSPGSSPAAGRSTPTWSTRSPSSPTSVDVPVWR